MTLNGVMAVTLRYFTEFGKHTFHHNRRVDLRRNLCTSLLYFVLRVDVVVKKFTFTISSPDEFLVIFYFVRALTLKIPARYGLTRDR